MYETVDASQRRTLDMKNVAAAPVPASTNFNIFVIQECPCCQKTKVYSAESSNFRCPDAAKNLLLARARRACEECQRESIPVAVGQLRFFRSPPAPKQKRNLIARLKSFLLGHS